MPLRRLALAAAGTGGHVYPGLALAEQLESRGVAVTFLGTDRRAEQQAVLAQGFPLETLHARALIGRRLSPSFFSDNVRAVLEAVGALRRRSIQAVMSFGGYGGFAPVVAARTLGLLSIVHESNQTLGFASRVLAPIADEIFWGSESAMRTNRSGRFTGTPVRSAILEVGPRAEDDGVRPPRVFVTGGSQGAAFLDQHAPAALAAFVATCRRPEVIHQAEASCADVADRYRSLGLEARVEPFLTDIAATYAWADVVICRAGASTLAELSACDRKALVIPIPGHARNHQRANAEVFVKAGGGTMMMEADWSQEEAAAKLVSLFRSPQGQRSAVSASVRTADAMFEAFERHEERMRSRL
ncbi:MAG: UDP-N-acetylglucosamine--N-acetylmuramyl-(pentapeptide) pyrophosphoryl-undecaprenol N-acetylglucosamine transferase [Deltaproteobacteria bacterium]|nr:UDP-N-acetylglucosamine--N-acetylmuramyl-(pentapeptide) pyrophosphoryl-undecaprenol N-acetylglucosamine transferase [Deltaproteobacteria bacterium]